MTPPKTSNISININKWALSLMATIMITMGAWGATQISGTSNNMGLAAQAIEYLKKEQIQNREDDVVHKAADGHKTMLEAAATSTSERKRNHEDIERVDTTHEHDMDLITKKLDSINNNVNELMIFVRGLND